MKIETQFKINDEVFHIDNKTQRITKGRISKINLEVQALPIMKKVEGNDIPQPTGEYEVRGIAEVYHIGEPRGGQPQMKLGNQIARTMAELIQLLNKPFEVPLRKV